MLFLAEEQDRALALAHQHQEAYANDLSYELLAQLCLYQKRYTQAQEYLEEIDEKHDNQQFIILQVKLLLCQDRPEEALALIERTLQTFQMTLENQVEEFFGIELFVLKGLSHLLSKEMAQALDAFQACLDASPAFASSYVYLGAYYLVSECREKGHQLIQEGQCKGYLLSQVPVSAKWVEEHGIALL